MSDDTCPHGSMTGYCDQQPCVSFQSAKLAELYPTLKSHWRPYRYALDTNAPAKEKERLRQEAWKIEASLPEESDREEP